MDRIEQNVGYDSLENKEDRAYPGRNARVRVRALANHHVTSTLSRRRLRCQIEMFSASFQLLRIPRTDFGTAVEERDRWGREVKTQSARKDRGERKTEETADSACSPAPGRGR